MKTSSTKFDSICKLLGEKKLQGLPQGTEARRKALAQHTYSDEVFEQVTDDPIYTDFQKVFEENTNLNGVPFGAYPRYLQWKLCGRSHSLFVPSADKNNEIFAQKAFQVSTIEEHYEHLSRFVGDEKEFNPDAPLKNKVATIKKYKKEFIPNLVRFQSILKAYSNQLKSKEYQNLAKENDYKALKRQYNIFQSRYHRAVQHKTESTIKNINQEIGKFLQECNLNFET